ncbi:RNA-guided endonuclease InsQ/TnpB family protein [Pseudoclavibacter soli]|uniref:RNA-guided endonuclease InsQ/TnpB family protein n=1 Tax=Pseudoclavibacter soli TaxID=452623 RepID=UPI00248151DB|nr:transposase [Pseudoclavibacter soli]
MHRSRRNRYDKDGNLVPIGGEPDLRTPKQSRLTQSWTAAVPTAVLESPDRLERQDWFAAVKRRETLKQQGKDPGRMPRFRSRKHSPDIFACWYNNGRNARFQRVGRRSGIVFITGQNPGQYTASGKRESFVIRIHVRLSEPVCAYTSVRVNWDRRELVFVNDPQAITRQPTHKAVGIDRGVAVAVATSDGAMLRLPKNDLKRADRLVRMHQRAQARAIKASGKTTKDYYRGQMSKRFRAHARAISRLSAKASRTVADRQQKWSTGLVRDYDAIFIEDLNIAGMTSKTRPVPNPLRPGQYLPNGQARKRGLNRVMRQASLSRLETLIRYKADRAGVLVAQVPAPYTSQRCNACGHIAKDNRESQAVFSCINCGHTANADTNAARNILDAGASAHPEITHGTQQGRTCPGDGGTSDDWNRAIGEGRSPDETRTSAA